MAGLLGTQEAQGRCLEDSRETGRTGVGQKEDPRPVAKEGAPAIHEEGMTTSDALSELTTSVCSRDQWGGVGLEPGQRASWWGSALGVIAKDSTEPPCWQHPEP